MLFFTFSKADIWFAEQKLVWRTYTAVEALPMTKRVEIIDKKEFAAATPNADNETFVMHVAALVESITMPIHPSCQTQVATLISEENGILTEYSDFSNVFSSDSAVELLEYTEINNYPINLLDNKQLFYGPIYILGPVELETLKTYIKANLANGFIRPSKSSSGTPILFVRKKNGNLRLCVNYQGLNNLTIKNCYPLPLIGESLNRLGRIKRFT